MTALSDGSIALQTPWTNPVSAHQPLIDMATPQAERANGGKAVLGKRLTEAFESVPVAKKSRLSVVSAAQDDSSPADDGDGTGSLLNADEVGCQNTPNKRCWKID